MSDAEITLPEGWTRVREETQHSLVVVEYQRETMDDSEFVVSVVADPEKDGFDLQLATISFSPTRVRHEYVVGNYETLEEAVYGAESFIELLSHRMQTGEISSVNPQVETIQQTVESFKSSQGFPNIGRLIRQLW